MIGLLLLQACADIVSKPEPEQKPKAGDLVQVNDVVCKDNECSPLSKHLRYFEEYINGEGFLLTEKDNNNQLRCSITTHPYPVQLLKRDGATANIECFSDIKFVATPDQVARNSVNVSGPNITFATWDGHPDFGYKFIGYNGLVTMTKTVKSNDEYCDDSYVFTTTITEVDSKESEPYASLLSKSVDIYSKGKCYYPGPDW